MKGIGYPFWGGGRPKFCGQQGFELKCQDDDYPLIDIGSLEFRVLNISNSTYAMRIARTDFWDQTCPKELQSTTLNYTLFDYAGTDRNLTLFYGCPDEVLSQLPATWNSSNNFTCSVEGTNDTTAFYADEAFLGLDQHLAILRTCKINVTLPVLGAAIDELNADRTGGEFSNGERLEKALNMGFDVDYSVVRGLCAHCNTSGGICGSSNTSPFSCLCRDKSYPYSCQKSERLNIHRKVIIGVSAGVGTLLIASIFFLMYLRRYKKRYPPPLLSRNISSDPSSKTIFESQGSLHGVHIFTYEELEEATNNFDSSKELGDGGFGTVYHGKLRDGRVVAVKRLYENNYKRVEQFMNEVEILQLLRHRNLVSLYGCTSRHSRELLLVYEYVPNGTVADHLHGEQAKPGSLTWPTRMKIAIETASALKYLHASDIIHRDVKTNNILLDNNFSVKVADFGLSRLFPTDVTHVSTAPQGTPGYVDPDYHQCYQLTSKSDVYSFGVVLIELISSMPAVDITRHRHEINLSNMAINKIQNHALHELVDCSLGFDSDQNIRRMIMAVAELAFQCLQNEKEMRPAMDEVLEVLMGIESEGCNIVKTEEVEIPADSVGLLKSKQPPASPDSVTTNWISWSSTTNGSS